MAWTYSGNPAGSDKDAVRFELGDVNSADPLIQDEEIQYCLAKESSLIGAVARAAQSIAQRFAREASFQAGPLRMELTARAQYWGERAKELRSQANSAHSPSVGGLSQAAKDSAQANSDKTGPYFRRGMHDYGG